MDWGTVTFSYRSPSGERLGDCRSFNTGFQRPYRIRYEFVEPASGPARERRWITWTAARGGYATWTNWLPQEVDRVSLQKSLFRSWGMSESCGLSLKLLAPWSLSGPRSTEIYKPAMTEETIDNRTCWKIAGVCEDGAQAWIWIDANTWLVRRYRHAIDARLDGKPTNEIYTVEIHPLANPAMPPGALRFIPPDERRSRRSKHSHRRRRRKH
jgi:hypothetical protein